MVYYSYSLKFVLDDRTIKNGLKPVYVRMILNRKKTEIALHEFIDAGRWSKETGRIIKPKSSYEQHLNTKLNRIENQLNTLRLKLEENNEMVTGRRIKELFLGRDDKAKIFLVDFFGTYIQEITAKNEHSPASLRRYKQTGEKIGAYLKTISAEQLLLEQLSLKHIVGFETHLMTTPSDATKKQMSRNTANNYLKKFKAVVGQAARRELIKSNPFTQFKMHNVRTNKHGLTNDELNTFEKYDFSYDKTLQKVQNIFIFSAYTGLRFSDAMALTEANLVVDEQSQRTFIHTTQLKTKQPVLIPLLMPAKKVLNFFESQRKDNGGRLLWRISNQKCNSRLREIQGILKINTRLTTHVARHTAATVVLLENGVDLKTVSSWLGHDSIKSTEGYSKVTKTKLLRVAEQVEAAYQKRDNRTL